MQTRKIAEELYASKFSVRVIQLVNYKFTQNYEQWIESDQMACKRSRFILREVVHKTLSKLILENIHMVLHVFKIYKR